MTTLFGIQLSTVLGWLFFSVLYLIVVSMIGRVIHHGNGGDE